MRLPIIDIYKILWHILAIFTIMLLASVPSIAQVRTVLYAYDVAGKTGATQRLALNESHNIKFLFDFSQIPKNASMSELQLTLTLAAPPADQARLRLIVDGKQYTISDVYKFEERETPNFEVVFKIKGKNADGLLSRRDMVEFVVASNSSDMLSFYSNDLTNENTGIQARKSVMPRMLISYRVLSIEGQTEDNVPYQQLLSPDLLTRQWGNIYADAQNSSRLDWCFSGVSAASYSPQSFKAIITLSGRPQKGLLSYNGGIYFTTNTMSSDYLNCVAPYGKQVKPEIVNKEGTSVIAIHAPLYYCINGSGLFFDIIGDDAEAIDLNSTTFSKCSYINAGEKEYFAGPPVFGPDGTGYWHSDKYVYAMRAPHRVDTHFPLTRDKALWQYTANPSARIALSKDGNILFIAGKYEGKENNVISVNTTTGMTLSESTCNILGCEDCSTPVPVVLQDNTLVLRYSEKNCKAIYVYNEDSLKLETTISGEGFCKPLAGSAHSFYFADNEYLYKYTDRKVDTLARHEEGIVRSLIGNSRNDIFLLNERNELYVYDSTGKQLFFKKNITTDNAPLQAMLMENGALYLASNAAIYTLQPSWESLGDKKLSDYTQYHFNTLCAQNWTIDTDILSKQQIILATDKVNTAGPVKVKKGADARIVSKGGIGFDRGFNIERGAKISCIIDKM